MKKHRIMIFLVAFLTSLISPFIVSKSLGLSGVEGTANTIYLNLTKIGLLDGQAGVKLESQYLEYGVEWSDQVGAALPTNQRVTASNGASFVGWVIQSPFGGLQKLSHMPSTRGIILQAHFDKNPGGGTTEPPITSEPGTSEETNLVDLYVRFNTDEYLVQNRFKEGYSTILSTVEYSLLGVSATAGQSFYFGTPTNFAGIGDATLPSYRSNKSNGIGYTLSNGEVYKTTDYLQVVGANESGTTGDAFGSTYHKFNSPTPLGALTFKTTGTYDIYLVFWDNYGWAQVYVAPH